MIVRNAYLAGSRESARASANVERGQGEGAILPSSPNNRIAAPHHREVGAEIGNERSDDLPYCGRGVFIGRQCWCGADHGLPFSSTDGTIKTILCPACTAKAFPPGVGRISRIGLIERLPALRDSNVHAQPE